MKYDYVNSLIISSTKSSSILNKGPTIDCKGFSYYEHIICVYLGYDGCNVNIYSSELSDYSDTLIQKNNLVDLGFNCDSRSIGQKIFNIDATVIEILPEDNIPELFFLSLISSSVRSFGIFCRRPCI